MAIKLLPLLKDLSPAFGVAQIGFYILKLPATIWLWEKYLTGKTLPVRIPISDFLANLHRQKSPCQPIFYSWIFDNFKFDNFTLDIDSSVMTRYGVQQGAKKGIIQLKKEGFLIIH